MQGAKFSRNERGIQPDPMTVRRMIDDTLYAENTGLYGVAYFDCRYPKLPLQDLSAYEYC